MPIKKFIPQRGHYFPLSVIIIYVPEKNYGMGKRHRTGCMIKKQ